MVNNYKGYIIDLDGTIYLGKEKIPEAKTFIDTLLKKNITFRLVTNNTTLSPEAVKKNLLVNHDIDVPISTIYTASMATGSYLEKITSDKSKKVYIIGESGLKEELFAKGFIYEESNPDLVVVGLDRDLTYHKLLVASLAIRNGATFISTNPDVNLPNEIGFIPGSGSIAELLKISTGKNPIVIGKPSKIILELVAEQMKISKDELIIVGDNYNTDIKAGFNFGIDTLLVLTGITTKKEIAKVDRKPSYIVDNLGDWNLFD